MNSAQRQWPLLALALTLMVQTLAAVSQGIPAVLAPVLAPQFGLRAQQIGTFTGLLYVFAMLSGLLCSRYIGRFGAVRFSQLALLSAALGLGLIAAGNVTALLLCAALIGAGYGLANPTSALLLGLHAPANKRGLYFSLKQTGVPIGVAIAGFVAPYLYLRFGWQQALLLPAIAFVFCAAIIQPTVGLFDTRQTDATQATKGALGFAAMFAPLGVVLANSRLRRLGFVSLIYAATQVCLIAFLVAYLTLEHQLSLAAGAAILGVAQLTSIIGRPFWGWLADYWGEPAKLLGLLGVAMGAACVLLALMPTGVSEFHATVVAMLCAATAIAWNGVFYAELVRNVSGDELATVTGGTQFMTFAGGMLGPLLFGIGVTVSGQYWITFFALAVLPLIAGLNLYRQM